MSAHVGLLLGRVAFLVPALSSWDEGGSCLTRRCESRTPSALTIRQVGTRVAVVEPAAVPEGATGASGRVNEPWS